MDNESKKVSLSCCLCVFFKCCMDTEVTPEVSGTIVTGVNIPDPSLDLNNITSINNNIAPPSPYNDNLQSIREGTPIP